MVLTFNEYNYFKSLLKPVVTKPPKLSDKRNRKVVADVPVTENVIISSSGEIVEVSTSPNDDSSGIPTSEKKCIIRKRKDQPFETLSRDVDGKLIIPTIQTYEIVKSISYSLADLKEICNELHIKKTGNKSELTMRIYEYLLSCNRSRKIQKVYRGHLIRRYIKSGGEAIMRRDKCVNESDFFSLEPIREIEQEQFISYSGDNNIVYGFNIASILHLLINNYPNIQNPYTRSDIPNEMFAQLKERIRLSRLVGRVIELGISNDDINDLSEEKREELHVLDLFQHINSLGNYADPAWFNNMGRIEHLRFFREIMDIWNYRAELSNDMKCKICPPNGNISYGINTHLMSVYNLGELRKCNISVIQNLIKNGVDNDSKCLGAYYVLASLTVVSVPARSALPWLYESII
jgi:SAP domain-containing new25